MGVIGLTVDVLQYGTQHIDIASDATIHQLIRTIEERFTLDTGHYVLLHKQDGAPLPLDRTVSSAGLSADQPLALALHLSIPVGTRYWVGAKRVYLQEVSTGRVFDVQWQPALIGRPGGTEAAQSAWSKPTHDLTSLVTVPLDGLPNSAYVSRHHAQIIQEAGVYYLQTEASVKNAPKINGVPVAAQEKGVLTPGATIDIAGIQLIFHVDAVTG